MSEEIEYLKTEINHLAAETMALQTVLAHVLAASVKSGAISKQTLSEAFAQSDLLAEIAAIRMGKQAGFDYTQKFFAVVEFLRDQAIGKAD